MITDACSLQLAHFWWDARCRTICVVLRATFARTQAAVGHPLTVYGKGGQTRGFLDIRDTVRPMVQQRKSCSRRNSGQSAHWGIWFL